MRGTLEPRDCCKLPAFSLWYKLIGQSFTIHPLPTTHNLTLNRNLSGQPSAPPPVAAAPKRKADPIPAKESPKKKSRPSIVESLPKKTGGKTLPKKSIPAPVASGKVKSAEIIESSEDEDEEEEEDDFAALLGAEMAKGEDEDEDEGSAAPGIGGEVGLSYDDDSESGEEEDDDEL